MNFSKDWLNVATDRVFIVGVFDILFLIAPGVAVVYYFNAQLFASLDWEKLTLLSLAVTAPLSFVNSLFAIDLKALEDKKGEVDLFGTQSFAIVCTGVLIYVTLGICYFSGASFHSGVTFIAVVEVAALVYASIRERRQRRTR